MFGASACPYTYNLSSDKKECLSKGLEWNDVSNKCGDYSYDIKECTRNGMTWDSTANRCIPSVDTSSSVSYEKKECLSRGLEWNDVSNKCADTSYDIKECTRNGMTWDSAANKCIVSADTSSDKKECISRGMVWEPLTSKCLASSGSTGSTGATLTPGGATTGVNSNGILQFIKLLQTAANYLGPLLVTLALLAFFWFIVMFIWKGADNPTERQKNIGGMGWSILALFVMVSIWGIIYAVGLTLGIPQGGTMHGFILPGQTK